MRPSIARRARAGQVLATGIADGTDAGAGGTGEGTGAEQGGARRRWLWSSLCSLGGMAGLALGIGAPAYAGALEDWFLAIQLDRPAQLQAMALRGLDVNVRDASGQHGLYVALREESHESAAWLAAAPGLDVESPNGAGETLLMMAALKGRDQVMATLLARGAQVHREGWTPLHYAASGQSVQAVALLLGRDPHIDALAPNGYTALMMAAAYGAIDSADLLLRHGANPTLRNRAGLDAAELARRAGRNDLPRRLQAAAERWEAGRRAP